MNLVEITDPKYVESVTPEQYAKDVLTHLSNLNKADQEFLGNHIHGSQILYLRKGIAKNPVLERARDTRAELKAVLRDPKFLEGLKPIMDEFETNHQQFHK